MVTHDDGRSGRRLIELDNITSRYSELVKRAQVVVKQTDSCRDLFNKLMSNISSTSEWIKQLEQNISNYANLSGDRHVLQTRLELVKVGKQILFLFCCRRNIIYILFITETQSFHLV